MSNRAVWLCLCAVLVVGVAASVHRLTAAPAPARSAVVVELFTSEGCSSCPPADDVLTRLAHKQLTPDVDVIALGEHVDYWDRLGWRDPFSSAAFSARQSTYDDHAFHRNEVYTPQLVVDGQYEQVGSDVTAVRRAIARAAQAQKATVAVTVTRAPASGDLRVDVRADAPPTLAVRDRVDVIVAVTEDNLVTDVRRGENRGRTLKHSAVVRYLAAAGTWSPESSASATSISVPWQANWKAAYVRVIGFLQEHESRRIVGAGFATLDEPAGTH